MPDEFRELSEMLQRRCEKVYEAVIDAIPEKERRWLSGPRRPHPRYSGAGLTLMQYTIYNPAEYQQTMELQSIEVHGSDGHCVPCIRAYKLDKFGKEIDQQPVGVSVEELANFFCSTLGVAVSPMVAPMVTEMLKEPPPPPTIFDEEFDFS